MAVVYHWKHGWIPLDHTAALSKAKGNHALADKMLNEAPAANGIQSRQDVAKAIRDLPNVPNSHRAEALTHIREAAAKHDSMDLIPNGAKIQVRSGAYRGETGHTITGKDARGRAVKVFVPGSRAEADKVAANIKAGRDPFSHVFGDRPKRHSA